MAKEVRRRPQISIRLNPEIVHDARVAAVVSRKTLGKWIEEAIMEKINKER